MTIKHPEDLLPFLHGCCGFFSLNGRIGFSRFTEEQLMFYSNHSDSHFVASHSSAGIYLDFVTDEPEISFQYRMYRERGIELLNSGFDIWEDDKFGAHIAVCDTTDDVTVSYRRNNIKSSRIRIYFPNGNDLLMDNFSLGQIEPVTKRNKRIIFYGDSITQSAYIATPSLSWYVPMAEYLEAEYINRGIGSMIFDENSLPASDPIQPDIIIVEYGANDLNKRPDQQTALLAARAWLEKLCRVYPSAKIIGITPDFIYPHGYDEAHWQRFYTYCDALYALYQEMNIPVFRGYTLLPGLDTMFREDHVHLNETGSAWFAGKIAHHIKGLV